MVGEIVDALGKKTVPKDRLSERLGKAMETDVAAYQEAYKELKVDKMQFVRRIGQGQRSVFLYRLEGEHPQIVAVSFTADGKLDSVENWGLVE